MQKLKRFMGTSLIYLIGNVLSKLVSFFLLPLYTSKIAPEAFGYFDLVVAFVNLFAPIAFFQIWDGMFRLSFNYKEKQDKYKVVCNANFISLIGVVIYFFIFFILFFVYKFDNFWLVFIYGLFLSFNYLYGYICRVFLDNKFFVLSGFVCTFATAICNIVLILVFGWGVESLYVAPTVGIILQMIIVEFKYKIIKNFAFKYINKEMIVKMIKFSLPLCVTSVSYWLLSGFTKLMITTFLGTGENGLYAVANRFATMVTLVITIFQYAWNELAYMMADDNDRVKSYNICIDLLIKFAFIGCAGICVFVKIIFPILVDTQYGEALYIIPATIAGSVFNAVASFIATMFMTENKTNSIFYSTFAVAILNVILCYLFTNYFGLQGATISLAVSFCSLMIIRFVQARKKIKITIDLKSIVYLVAVLALAFAEFYLSTNLLIDVLSVVTILFIFILSVKKYLKMFFENKGKREELDKENNVK